MKTRVTRTIFREAVQNVLCVFCIATMISCVMFLTSNHEAVPFVKPPVHTTVVPNDKAVTKVTVDIPHLPPPKQQPLALDYDKLVFLLQWSYCEDDYDAVVLEAETTGGFNLSMITIHQHYWTSPPPMFISLRNKTHCTCEFEFHNGTLSHSNYLPVAEFNNSCTVPRFDTYPLLELIYSDVRFGIYKQLTCYELAIINVRPLNWHYGF